MAKFKRRMNVVAVRNVFRAMTRKCYEVFPGFGEITAIDSTDLKAFSNGRHKKPTDKDAGWVVKSDNHGKKKYVWGFKGHAAVCGTYEIPMAFQITSGNVSDVTRASNILT